MSPKPFALPRMRLAFLLSVVAFIFHVIGEDLVNLDDKYRNAATWPVGKEFVRLGYDGGPPKLFEKTGDYAWVEAPLNVVRAAKKRLRGGTKTWTVNKIMHEANSGKEVVVLEDRWYHCLVCLVDKDRWIRLNEPGGIPFIDDLLKTSWRTKLAIPEVVKQAYYLEDIAFFYKGPQRIVLSKARLDSIKTEWELWLRGREKRASELAKLCSDPIFTQSGTDLRIDFNVITDQGSVEKWTVRGEMIGRVVIHDITVETIKPPGTFSLDF
jgi:hypothetical protein